MVEHANASVEHVYLKCTRTTCPTCNGRGSVDALQDDPLSALTCGTCDGSGSTGCTGCRPDSGLDCNYEALSHCGICGCMEGSLLPFCPGRWVTMEEGDAFYAHYCAGTGPFAKATFDTLDVARERCYERCYPGARPVKRSSEGAEALYDAVCELWNLMDRRKRESQRVPLERRLL